MKLKYILHHRDSEQFKDQLKSCILGATALRLCDRYLVFQIRLGGMWIVDKPCYWGRGSWRYVSREHFTGVHTIIFGDYFLYSNYTQQWWTLEKGGECLEQAYQSSRPMVHWRRGRSHPLWLSSSVLSGRRYQGNEMGWSRIPWCEVPVVHTQELWKFLLHPPPLSCPYS